MEGLHSVTKFRKRVDSLCEQQRHCERRCEEERRGLAQAHENVKHTEIAQTIVQGIAQKVQSEAHLRIASIVTRCLHAVFGEDSYDFRIVFDRKRGKTEARLLFVRDGKEYDPLSSSGGGVVDVASFALRLACLLLSRPVRRRLLVLDEPMKHLSSVYRPAICELLQRLTKELSVQMIMVSHSEEFQIGKVIEL